MATTTSSAPATRLPGPPELLPGRPDAIVDLQTAEGVGLVGGEWRYRDARVEETAFVELAGEGAPDPLGPGEVPNRTYLVTPRAQGVGFDDSAWRVLAPEETMARLGNGLVSFNWYRIEITVPERVGEMDPAGSTLMFETVVDDYAEVWVDGELPLALGDLGGQVAAGFNAPNRVLLGRGVQPGDRFVIAVFGVNGPISAAPHNYIWMRHATLSFYEAGRVRLGREVPFEVARLDARLERIVPEDALLEQVAGGFEFTEGPVWTRDGALLFSSPNTNVIYRWDSHTGAVTVFDPKSGYTGTDIGRYHQPGSNGLTFDPEGRLVMCQHGNRRVVRVNPHGDVTVVADAYEGRRLNSPNDVVVRSDGTVFFTDPPFGLPGAFGDPARDLPFSGVFRARDGRVELVTDELEGPNGLAFSPDGRHLYVGNWDPERKVVMRYELDADGNVLGSEELADLTPEPGDDALDGLKVDVEGHIYVCGPGGVWILSPEGERLGLLRLPEDPHNLAWGGDDARTLYVTALTGVYRLTLSIPGIRPE